MRWKDVNDGFVLDHPSGARYHISNNNEALHFGPKTSQDHPHGRSKMTLLGTHSSKDEAISAINSHMTQTYGKMEKSMRGTQHVAGMKGHPNNDRSWPNNKPEIEGDNWDDSIKDNGTDYIGKSFAGHAYDHPVIVEGVTASPLIKGVIDDISVEFDAMEKSLNNEIDQMFGDFGEFDQQLGLAVISIGKSVGSVNDRVDTLNKSIAGGYVYEEEMVPGNIEVLSKGGVNQDPEWGYDEILEAMVKSAIQGDTDVTPLDVQKFEMSNGTFMPERVAKSIGLG